jgi:Xaa-Pro aminopeptidase
VTTQAPLGPFPPGDHPGRLARLRQRLAEEGLDALVVTSLVHVRYLTGFSGSAGRLVLTPEDGLLLTDGRYRTQVEEQLQVAGVRGLVEPRVSGLAGQQEALVELLGASGRRVGLEADHLSWSAARRTAELLPEAELVPTTGLVEGLRLVKDPAELARLEAAAHVADQALAEVLGLLAPGHQEREVAEALDHAMRRLGAEDRAFETIVASGPNAAKPHARPGDRVLAPGDTVVVDFGATVDGYRSDMTRTFILGPVGEDLEAAVALVHEAQALGVAAVAPGRATGEVDAACRDRIAAAGLAERFEHATGHGVGLEVHEAPAVAAGATAILAPGVVVTVEPGVYLPGRGGVRVEDTVVVTDDGCRPLTRFPKEPVLPL